MSAHFKAIEALLEAAQAVVPSWEDYQNGEIHAAELTARVTQLEETCSTFEPLLTSIQHLLNEVQNAQRFEREAMERMETVFAENKRIRELLFKLKLSSDPAACALAEEALKGALDARFSEDDTLCAKRYRWLRAADAQSEPAVVTVFDESLNGEKLDKHLDAAISAALPDTFLQRMRR